MGRDLFQDQLGEEYGIKHKQATESFNEPTLLMLHGYENVHRKF